MNTDIVILNSTSVHWDEQSALKTELFRRSYGNANYRP